MNLGAQFLRVLPGKHEDKLKYSGEIEAAEKWLKKNKHLLPSMDTGRDEDIVRYKFLPVGSSATSDMGDDIDDRDGVDYASENYQEDYGNVEHKGRSDLHDEEKAAAYDGMESTVDAFDRSSGSCASSWHCVEDALCALYKENPSELSPSQWIRREKQRDQSVTLVNRKKRANYKLAKVFRDPQPVPTVEQPAVVRAVNPENLPLTRLVLHYAWDDRIKGFQEYVYEQFTDVGVEHARTVAENDSPNRVAQLRELGIMEPGKPVSYPSGPVREWNGDGPLTKEAFRNSFECKVYKFGDLDGWLKFRDRTEQASVQAKPQTRVAKPKAKPRIKTKRAKSRKATASL